MGRGPRTNRNRESVQCARRHRSAIAPKSRKVLPRGGDCSGDGARYTDQPGSRECGVRVAPPLSDRPTDEAKEQNNREGAEESHLLWLRQGRRGHQLGGQGPRGHWASGGRTARGAGAVLPLLWLLP